MIKEEEEGRPWSAHVSVERDPPPAGDVIVLSTDLAGGADPVSGKVLSKLGLSDDIIPDSSSLARSGFSITKGPSGSLLCFIVAEAESSAEEEGDTPGAIAANLAACLQSVGNLPAKTMWLPLMAAGRNWLRYDVSLRAMLNGLRDSGIVRSNVDIIIAAPEDTTAAELSELNEIVREAAKGDGAREPDDKTPRQEVVGEQYHDTSDMQDDRPTTDDLLGRRPIAESLAKRIDRMADWGSSADRNSIMIQLHAPWGAGKTSFVQMLSGELKNLNPRWTLVTFNAWENQRINPPWWMLYDTIFRTLVRSKDHLSLHKRVVLRVKEVLWRLTVGNGVNLAFVIVGILVLIAVMMFRDRDWLPFLEKNVDVATKAIAGLIALLATIGAIVRTAINGLLTGGSKAAQGFVEVAQDPITKLRRHYERLLKNIERRILVFIDDLDRCTPTYVLALLEGVQTMFAHPHVVWLVAADRRWIAEAFEAGYPVAKSVAEPGNRLGYQFLEKAFQLMIALPRISPESQTDYWRRMLTASAPANVGPDAPAGPAYEAARNQLKAQTSEARVLAVIRENANLGPALVERLRRDAVERMAAPEIEKTAEHLLMRFGGVIKPNPRAMKRLVNSYAVLRDVTLISNLPLWNRADLSVWQQRVELARWVILCMDAPLLLDALEQQPELLRTPPGTAPKSIADALQPLWLEPRIQKLLCGFSEQDMSVGALQPDFVREFAPLRG